MNIQWKEQQGFSTSTVLTILLVAALAFAIYWMIGSTTNNEEPTATEVVAENSFAVSNIRLFDGERVLNNQTVLVKDGLIQGIDANLAIPEGIENIDGTGKTLLPGLIDAHVHTFGTAQQDALRFGVTTAIDLFSDHRNLAEFVEQREAINQQNQADVYSAGTLVTAAGGHGTQFGMPIPTLDDVADAESFIADRIAEGSDFIKLVYEDGSQYGGNLPTLDQARLTAAIGAAQAQGLLTIVHVSTLEHGKQALRAGANGLAHMFSDQVADDEFIQLALEKQAFVVPTLAVLASVSNQSDVARWLDKPEIVSLLNGMQRDTVQRQFPFQDADHINNGMASVARLHAADVPILAGSDAPNPGTAHGIGAHQELWWLVQAGLTPVEALEAATAKVADAFGLTDRGRIVEGLRADLVLVAGDPLTDIDSSFSIDTIWKDGFPVQRSVAEVEQQAASTDWPGEQHRDGLLADFETSADLAMRWQVTTDQIMNGSSEALVEQRTDSRDADNQVLYVSGAIKPGTMFPWAGVVTFTAEQPMQPVDASGISQLVFRARGLAGQYQLMVFSGEQANSIPVISPIELTDEWQEFSIDLVALNGVDMSLLRGFAWTAGMGLSEFEFELDDVKVR